MQHAPTTWSMRLALDGGGEQAGRLEIRAGQRSRAGRLLGIDPAIPEPVLSEPQDPVRERSVVLRARVVRRRRKQWPSHPPHAPLERDARRIAALLRTISWQQLGIEQQRDVFPLASRARRHRLERGLIGAICTDIIARHVIREASECRAVPAFSAARQRCGNRAPIESGLHEVSNALGCDPPVRGVGRRSRVERRDQVVPRIANTFELTRRRRLFLIVPIAEPPNLLVARTAAAG